MDFYVIDHDFSAGLKNQGSSLPEKLDKHLASLTQAFHLHNISMHPETMVGLNKTYPFLKRKYEPHVPFYEISEQILSFVIKEKIKRVYFFTHSAFPHILLHDLNNVGAEVYLVNEGDEIPKIQPLESFLNSLLPLFLHHAQDYLTSVKKIQERELFNHLMPAMKSFRASSFDSTSEYLVIVQGDESLKASFTGKIDEKADALVFTQKFSDNQIHYPNSVNGIQDFSYILYRPLIGSQCQFIVRRKFYDSLSAADQALLKIDPNWVFYKHQAHVIGTLLKTNSSVIAERNLEEIDADFERDYFHKTHILYKSTMALNKVAAKWKF